MEAPVGLLPEGMVYRIFGNRMPGLAVAQVERIDSRLAGFNPSESAMTSEKR